MRNDGVSASPKKDCNVLKGVFYVICKSRKPMCFGFFFKTELLKTNRRCKKKAKHKGERIAVCVDINKKEIKKRKISENVESRNKTRGRRLSHHHPHLHT